MRRFLISAFAVAVVASTVATGFAVASTSQAGSAPGVHGPLVPNIAGAPTREATKAAEPVTLSYGPHGTRNTLDVYTPASAEGKTGRSLPTLVLVHGGSWIGGDRETLADEAKQFVELGYVAIAVDYRRATQAPWPAQRTDVRRALDCNHENAEDLNVDSTRVVLLGTSAGAEIAASTLTLDHGRDLARGLVSLSAPLDKKLVVDRFGLRKNATALANVVTEDLLGCAPAECPALYERASPRNYLDAGDVPMLLFASRKEWVDPQGTYDFHAAALAAGVPSELVVLPGTRHSRSYMTEVWPTITDWVAERMAADA